MRKRLDEAAWGRFAERLARLLDGGVPLLEALSFLERRGTGREQTLTRGIGQRLHEGRLLSQALVAEEAPLMIRVLVEVGEHNGDLAGSLFRSGEYCAEKAKWRKESKQAMIYPLLVCFVLLFLSLFLFQVVIPRFADLYAGMGLQMASGTRMMIAVAAVAPRLLMWGLCGVGLLWLIGRYVRIPFRKVQLIVHRVPGIRTWVELDRTHEWASTLGSLLDGGLPLIQALEVQSQLPLKQENREICQRVRERVLKGMTLGDALQAEALDERLMLSVQVAEVTGDLSRALLAVERELATARKQMMNTLLKMMEPVLMVVAGTLVGMVALFMLWPMFDLLNSI